MLRRKLGSLRGNFVAQDFMDVCELGLLAEGLTELLSAIYEVISFGKSVSAYAVVADRKIEIERY